MEARIEAELGHLYGMAAADYRSVGKRNSEWKLDNWKWDGDLFLARSLNPVPSEYLGHQFFPVTSANVTAGNSSNSSSSCSDEANIGFENGKREMEKRRRVVVVEDDNNLNEKVSSLGLNLGGQGYPIVNKDVGSPEGNSAKKTKIAGSSTSRAVCQVEDCDADLSKGKEYHRRHKVCEIHSKASNALVGNIMQRFCQQCSRFHALQEFDEGKRSCRRRLAGHNKRRRKTNPEPDSNASALNDQSSSFLLISLLKILTNMHNNQSKEATDPDLLTHLLRTLGGNQGGHESKNVSNLLSESQNVVIGGVSDGKIDAVHTMVSKGVEGTTPRLMKQPQAEPTTCDINGVRALAGGNPTGMQNKPNNFDLNDVYIDLDDGTEDLETVPNPRTYSVDCPSWLHRGSNHSSPPQTSRTSDSASTQSPSSSTGDVQSRTDRIVFKLFGKEPNDFPLLVRAQILDWLAHSPTDIESYIRPGCVILTIYLRQSEDAWEELCYDLSSSLGRLLDVSDDTFWKTGWMCIRIQHQMAFIHNGRVVLDRSLPFESVNSTKILSVRPIAVSASDSTQFLVRGINLSQPTTRLLCALEGQYLLQESVDELLDEDGSSSEEHDELQCIKFSCSVPRLTGRGFIEIEEDGGLSSSFFPFIIAEEDVCSEIRTLETSLELLETDPDADRSGEMEFINEMGWILHRSGTRSRLAHLDPNPELFSFVRFRWLMEFSMDRDWSAVVKKLLDIVLDGSIDSGDHPSLYAALLDTCLVHRAVRRNNRALVELLLGYVPRRVADNLGHELELLLLNGSSGRVLLFKPDAVGPGGLTPLHIAAGKDGSEEVLDALTEDPGKVGIQAWKNARDSTGSTPEDYARLRGHYSYIHLIQRKINRCPTRQLAHVVLDIPDTTIHNNHQEKQHKASLEIMQTEPKPVIRGSCKMCDQKVSYGIRSRSLPYRPAMLSMVAIAAVCVCVALLFKSCPEVLYVFGPFRWELLEYGAS